MRQETEVHFLVGTVILGFLSIFKKNQASSSYEALNSLCLSCVLYTSGGQLWLSLGSPQGIQACLHLMR